MEWASLVLYRFLLPCLFESTKDAYNLRMEVKTSTKMIKFVRVKYQAISLTVHCSLVLLLIDLFPAIANQRRLSKQAEPIFHRNWWTAEYSMLVLNGSVKCSTIPFHNNCFWVEIYEARQLFATLARRSHIPANISKYGWGECHTKN